MSEIHLPLRQDRLAQMREGSKKADVRVGNEKTRRIKAGDHITFRSRDDRIRMKVAAVRTHRSFEDMLKREDYRRIAPEMVGEGQLLEALCDFYPYHEEAKGVYVFEIQNEQAEPH